MRSLHSCARERVSLPYYGECPEVVQSVKPRQLTGAGRLCRSRAPQFARAARARKQFSLRYLYLAPRRGRTRRRERGHADRPKGRHQAARGPRNSRNGCHEAEAVRVGDAGPSERVQTRVRPGKVLQERGLLTSNGCGPDRIEKCKEKAMRI